MTQNNIKKGGLFIISDRYNHLILRILAGLFILGVLLALIYSHNKTQPLKKISSPDKPADRVTWYVQFSVKDQKTTAYTEQVGAPKASNGRDYFSGGIAVHPRSPGIDPRKPILPFGTVIYLNEPVKVQGEERDSLVVIDTGDIYYGLWPDNPYWFDVYYGTSNYYNSKDARDYGVKIHDYFWLEKWR